MDELQLQERILKLEDLEAIKNVTARYAHAINQGWNGQKVDAAAIPKIFTQDAIWESPDLRIKAVGLEEIIAILLEETKSITFAMHSFSDPIIHVGGDKATGHWLFRVESQPSKVKFNQVMMSTDISYAKTETGWKINQLKLYFGNLISHAVD